MRTSILNFLLIAIPFFAQAQQEKVIITGKMNGDTKGYEKIYMYTRLSSDSATMENGHYRFEVPFNGPTARFFYTEYDKNVKGMYSPFALLIDKPGAIHISGNIEDGLNASTITGGEAAMLYQSFKKEQSAAYNKSQKKLEKIYGKSWLPENDPKAKALEKSRDSLNSIYQPPLLKKMVKSYPGSYATVFILAGSARTLLPVGEQEKLYNSLTDEMKQTEEGKNIYAHIEGIKNSGIGNKVNNFILNGPNETPVNFNSFKGKYVLVDFWASWCAPCRQSFPRMRQVYDIFKENGFEIYSISIDKSKAAWLKAVKEENNPWPQSLDTKNIAASGFAVTAVPTTYLIDPEGTIIMKEIGFDPEGGGNMEKKLENIFDKQVPEKDKPQPVNPAGKEKIKSIPMKKMN